MQICTCANEKMCKCAKSKYANVKITESLFANLHRHIYKLSSTGTRIRTKIKGFGDPYATVAPFP